MHLEVETLLHSSCKFETVEVSRRTRRLVNVESLSEDESCKRDMHGPLRRGHRWMRQAKKHLFLFTFNLHRTLKSHFVDRTHSLTPELFRLKNNFYDIILSPEASIGHVSSRHIAKCPIMAVVMMTCVTLVMPSM